jgi:glucose-1-phosphate cytidylyltransferase
MESDTMQVIILCGGKGLRMRGIPEDIPKSLIKVNGQPIIWHIMKLYSNFGHNEFILPLGYKGEKIKEYFMDLVWKDSDFVLNLGDNKYTLMEETEKWNITFADTGLDTMTGARIKNIEKYINDDTFMFTYGDGLANIDINKLIELHKMKGKIVTLTGINKQSQYGLIKVENGIAKGFEEKPKLDLIINGGFFVCNREFFNYLSSDNNCVLEEEPLKNLIKDGELAVFEHDGFWIGIDTPKDIIEANEKWTYQQKGWDKYE